MTDENAALDENMPPVDEAPAIAETPETGTDAPAESAPAPVDDSEFVDIDNDKVQARINKITAEKYAERRRAEAVEEELARLKAAHPTPTPTTTGEPKLEDFDFDDAAYTAAMIDYKVNQKAQEIQQNQAQQVQEQQRAERLTTFQTKAAEFKAKSPDFDEVVSLVPRLPDETLDAVMQSDNGPQLAYYLGKHLDVADQIATMSPAMAGIKLGQISAQLSAPTKTVTPSAAPEPFEPVESSGSLSKNLEDMTMDEIYNMP